MYYSLATWPSVPRTYEVTICLSNWGIEHWKAISLFITEKKKLRKKFKVIKTEEAIIERVYKWFQALDDNVFQT